MENGIFSKFLSWPLLPANSDTTIMDWVMGAIIIAMISIAWGMVVSQIK